MTSFSAAESISKQVCLLNDKPVKAT